MDLRKPVALTLWLALPASTTLAAQNTIIVTGGGRALIVAVANANHGDTLIVRPAPTDYTNVMVDKGLTILCDPGVTFEGFLSTPIGARNVPAGRTLAWRGGRMWFAMHTADAFRVENCRGNVVFEDLIVDATQGGTIIDSPYVTLNRCTLRSIKVTRSTVAFADCQVFGSAEIQPGVGGAVSILQSNVSIAGGSFLGWDSPYPMFAPTPGIRLRSGSLTLAGNATTTVRGGNGTPNAPAIATLSGFIRIEPAVQLLTRAGQPITGGAVVRTERIPSVRADGVGTGQTFTADVHAPALSYTATFVSWIVPPVSLPFGDLWVDPFAPLFDAGIVPPNDTRSVSLVVPTLPRGLTIVLQAASARTDGTLVVGPPTVVVLD